ncbi:uncharacterized protein EKO05_0003572 [Ascochyta rabiei]|uniref:Uncharacterized protein n=1 Tax=Didymella rabiei TaxID=5454 RepID=A0A163ABQ4_DIDRA|nr:uncharacterized protein EKO05_0003572 [Ascochyta rabiei]KZM21101.1 hypothetical protein ST47_g7766 [Ascochyta rabiei]UPX13043.1 hypothetical protein EKO05_0003572 [Ascochyta rabiei]
MRHLPDELLLQIIAFLEPPELVSLQHVSRQFLNLGRDNKLWKQLCFSHSYTERRRRRLETTVPSPPAEPDPRVAELIEAANSLADTFDMAAHNPHAPGAEAQLTGDRDKRSAALLDYWDPSGLQEKVNWYEEFVQRHAPAHISWFQHAGHDDDDEARREATGAGLLFDADGLASKLVAPLDDGSIKIWDASAQSSTLGTLVAQSDAGLLSDRGPDLGRHTRLAQTQAIMTDTGAVECVSIDSTRHNAFFAVQNTLNQVDLTTLQIVSRTPYPFPITALSEAHHSTPLTVGTNWTLHLHDTRKPAPPSSRLELLNTPPTSSFSRLACGDFGDHVSLTQPGPLSIAHLPPTLGDGNGNIWVSGRFTSLLHFDRRFFPRLRGTVHSGARTSSLTVIPHPFIPHNLRLGAPHASPGLLLSARQTPGMTLVAAGAYKGKGSLELYSLSPSPTYAINSADARTTRNTRAHYQNRQTASSSKLLAVAAHGTRIVFSDGEGNLKWVERDARTPVRALNINDASHATKKEDGRRITQPRHPSSTASGTAPGTGTDTGTGDMVQRILPTISPTISPPHPSPPALGTQNLLLWTGDGRLGLAHFGRADLCDADTFEDALEHQADTPDRSREREYSLNMRRALEQQARELRWLRGYGL